MSERLTRDELGQAVTFADLAVSTLLDGQDDSDGGHDLDEAIEHRADVWQAQGMVMVMVMLGVTLAEALVRLRAHAYTEDRRLSEVAADIVARRLLLHRDQT